MNLDSLRSAADLSATKPHGTRLKYMGGCKCMLCRAANSRYETERAVARKNGDWNGIVDARAARRHILKLSKAWRRLQVRCRCGQRGPHRRCGDPGRQEAPHPAEDRAQHPRRHQDRLCSRGANRRRSNLEEDQHAAGRRLHQIRTGPTSWVENTSPSVRPLRGNSEDGRTRRQVLPGDHAWRRCAPEEGGMSNTHHTDIP